MRNAVKLTVSTLLEILLACVDPIRRMYRRLVSTLLEILQAFKVKAELVDSLFRFQPFLRFYLRLSTGEILANLKSDLFQPFLRFYRRQRI